MTSDPQTLATEIICGLSAAGNADPATAEKLFPVVYDELRRLARGYMSRETPGHTLQPTAAGARGLPQAGRPDAGRLEGQDPLLRGRRAGHAAAAGRPRARARCGQARRRLAECDPVRGRRSPARGSGRRSSSSTSTRPSTVSPTSTSGRRGSVTLRFFGGLTVEQVAEVLGVSKRTVEKTGATPRPGCASSFRREGAGS